MRALLLLSAALAGSIALAIGSAHAQQARSGSLDPSFGRNGKVTTSFGSKLSAQPNGRIVAAGGYGDGGNFALARFDTDGSLDASFGTGGWVMTHFGSGTGTGVGALARQPDGKGVAAGPARECS